MSKQKKNERWGTLRSALLSLYLNTKCSCGGRRCEQCRAAIDEATHVLARDLTSPVNGGPHSLENGRVRLGLIQNNQIPSNKT